MSGSLWPGGWDSPGKNTGVGCHFLLPGDLPYPGIEPRSPTLQADALTSEPPGKPLYKLGTHYYSKPEGKGKGFWPTDGEAKVELQEKKT